MTENLMSTLTERPLAAVTAASAGIGYELAKCCVEHGYDLLIGADDARIHEAAGELRAMGAAVEALETDLATADGVERFYRAANGHAIDALLTNAGRGLGQAFLDQSFEDIERVVDANVTGRLLLLHKVGQEMRQRGRGRILVTGSTAGYTPGTSQAVYDGTKAFLDAFTAALREELADSGVTVTCLMPGVTDTEFFARAGLEDTKPGSGKKADPAKLARMGFAAMLEGEADVVAVWRNKLQVAASGLIPAAVLARQQRKQAEPGSTRDRH
jgi:short-subunit dehydrogenase